MAFSFLKRGADSAKLAARAAAEIEAKKASQGKLFRFFMKDAEEARITFVDGELAKTGALAGHLDQPRFYEHNLCINGSWNNHYVCPVMTNPDSGETCPACEDGNKPALVVLFTIIDHRSIPSTKDKAKVWKDTKKLLVAKPQTFEMLSKHAIKRKGLAGATFDASRVGDKSAAVGSMFEFVEKNPIEELQKLYMIERVDPKTNQKVKVTNFTPADYDKEIVYRTGAELRKELGKDKGDDVPFKEGSSGTSPSTGPVDYSQEL